MSPDEIRKLSKLDQAKLMTKTDENFMPGLAIRVFVLHLLAAYGLYQYHSLTHLFVLYVAHVFFQLVGVTVGHHKYFSHKAFVAKPWLSKVLAIIATSNNQGTPIKWAAVHRPHHQYEGSYGDALSAYRGFWWSHLGWIFYRTPHGFDLDRMHVLVPDLYKDKFLVGLEKNYALIAWGMFILPLVIFMAIGRVDLWFVLFPVRIITVLHATFLQNSFMHGARLQKNTPPTGTRNFAPIELLTPGEGFHYNHHDRPAGIVSLSRFPKLDAANAVISLFVAFGWASKPRR
jgi:fatty-acid desaturase